MNDSVRLPVVEPLDRSLGQELQRIIDAKTKPPGSLGRLEALARQIGMIQRSTRPTLARPAMIVFAADHGIADEGVSPYPQAVTAQMVANFVAGGAAINAISSVAGFTLEVVNAGVATPLDALPGLVDIPIGPGTRNFAREWAMTREAALAAIAAGAQRVRHHAALGTNVIGFGEMGIANTSAAACLMSRLAGVPIDDFKGAALDFIDGLQKGPLQGKAIDPYAIYGGQAAQVMLEIPSAPLAAATGLPRAARTLRARAVRVNHSDGYHLLGLKFSRPLLNDATKPRSRRGKLGSAV